MEDILYDYHLADAMARMEPRTYDRNVVTYRAAVLKKYGVTEAMFDTSMVYYMRHTERLHTIYEHIAERMSNQAQEYGSSASSLSRYAGSASGDTVDIWKGSRTLALIPHQPYNMSSFYLKADSTYHKGDSFIMTMSSNFVFQDGARDGIAYLAVVFKNDSVATKLMHVTSSYAINLTIEDKDSLGVKELKGYFMLNTSKEANASSTTLHLMTLNDIRLYRCRSRKKSALRKDGVEARGDSAGRANTAIVGESTENTDSARKRLLQ